MLPFEPRKAAWDRLARDLDREKLSEITHEISLDEVIATAPTILSGEVRGQIVVKIPDQFLFRLCQRSCSNVATVGMVSSG